MFSLAAVNNSLQQKKLNEKLTKEKEETLCKQKYQRALSFQSKALLETSEEQVFKYACEALKEYIELLNDSQVKQAVVSQKNKVQQNSKEKISSKILLEQRKIQKNSFLYLKYLILKNMAEIYKILRQPEEALECYWKAIQIDDTDISVWLHLGLLCFEKEEYASARTALERVLIFQPDHPLAVEKMVEILFIIGDYYECLQWAQKLSHNENSNAIISACKKELDYQSSSFFDLLDNELQSSNDASPFISRLEELSTKFNSSLSSETTAAKKKVLLIQFEKKNISWEFVGNRIVVLVEKYLKQNQNRIIKIEIVERKAVDEIIETETGSKDNQVIGIKRAAENEIPDKRRQIKRVKKTDQVQEPIIGLYKLPSFLSKLLENERLSLSSLDVHAEPDQSSSSQTITTEHSVEEVSNELCLALLETIVDSTLEFRIKDVALLFLETLCSKLFSHKILESVLRLIRVIARELLALNYTEFSSITYTALASLFVQKYFESDQISNLIVARRLLHQLQGSLSFGDNSPSIEIQCRALWLLSTIEHRLNSTSASIDLLTKCKTIVQHNHFSLSFINSSFIHAISLDLLEQKIRSLNFNTEIATSIELMNNAQYLKALHLLLRLKTSSSLDDYDCERLDSLLIDCFYLLEDKTFEQLIQVFRNVSGDVFKTKFEKIGHILHYFFSVTNLEKNLAKMTKSIIMKLLHCIVYICDSALQVDEAEREFVYILYIFYWASKPYFSHASQYYLLKNMRIIFSMGLEAPAELCNFEYLIEQFYELLLVSDSSISLQNAITEELLILYHITFNLKLTNPRSPLYDFSRFYQTFLKDTKPLELHSAKIDLIELAFLLLQPYAETLFSEDISDKKVQLIMGQLKNVLGILIKSVPSMPNSVMQKAIEAKMLISKNYFITQDATSTRRSICEIRKNHTEKDSLYGRLHQYYGYCMFDLNQEFFTPNESFDFAQIVSEDFFNMINSLEYAVGCYPGNQNTWSRLGRSYFYLCIALSDLQDSIQREQYASKITCVDKQEQPSYVAILETVRHKALQCFFISNTIQNNTTAMYYSALLLFDQIQFEKFKNDSSIEEIRELCHKALPLISKCVEKEPNNSDFLILNGWLLELDQDRAIGCLELYERAVRLKPSTASIFELQNSLLALLRQNRPEFIQLAQRYSRKVSVEAFSGLAKQLYETAIAPMFQSVPDTNENKVWMDVTMGFLECIDMDESYKSLYKLAECCCFGPWTNWNIAQEVMSNLLKPRTVKGKPTGFHYNFKVSSQLQLITMGKNFRVWRYKSTTFYVQILKQIRNLDLFSIVCTGLRRSYLKEAPELFDAYRIALNTYAETLFMIYNQTAKKEDLEKMKFLRYVNELCIYFNDKTVKGKYGFVENGVKIFELQSKVGGVDAKKPSSSLEWKQFIQKTKDLYGLDFSTQAKQVAGTEMEVTPLYHSGHDAKLFTNVQESDIMKLVNSQREEEEEDRIEVSDEVRPINVEEDSVENAEQEKMVLEEVNEDEDSISIDLNITSQPSQTVPAPLDSIGALQEDAEVEEDEIMEDQDIDESKSPRPYLSVSGKEESIIDLDNSSDEEEDDDDVLLVGERRRSIVNLSSDEGEEEEED